MNSLFPDIVSGHLAISDLVENMAGVLTHNDPENRRKGMSFYTKILKELPQNYLNEMQVKFICKFYIDRLKDHHCVVPAVLEGYSTLIDMTNYKIQNCADFLPVLFQEVTCQMQLRQDRYTIYLIIQKLCNMDMQCKFLMQFNSFNNGLELHPVAARRQAALLRKDSKILVT